MDGHSTGKISLEYEILNNIFYIPKNTFYM